MTTRLHLSGAQIIGGVRRNFPPAKTVGLFLVEDVDAGEIVPYMGFPDGSQEIVGDLPSPSFFREQREQGIHWVMDPTYGTAAGDDATDCRAAFQAAIDAAVAGGGGVVQIPPGIFRILGDLNLTGLWGTTQVTIRGAGKFATYIKPAYVNASGSVFDLTGSSNLTFERFSTVSSGSHGQVFLMARVASNNSAGQHVFRDMRIIGNCTNATVVGWGSEENQFYSTEIYAVANKPALASAIKISELGFTPASAFQTVGTGAGGAGMWSFYGCRFENGQGVATTAPLVNIRGALGWLFSNCFTAHAGTKTYEVGSSTYPSNAADSYPSVITFDTCSDEDRWTVGLTGLPITKDSIYFAAPAATNNTLPTCDSLVVRACQFFNLTAADTAIIDGFLYEGGKYSNSRPDATGQTKMSFYDLWNARVAPSQHERHLQYTVRHFCESVEWVGIDSGMVAAGTGSRTIRDSDCNISQSGGLKSKSPTAGIGYEAGAGGAVTQATSATTAVTLNTVTGRITTVSLTVAAGAEVAFTVNNSAVTSLDVPLVVIQAYSGNGTPQVRVRNLTTGAFVLVIRNLHAADALSAAVTLNFVLLKGINA